jgi:hypothetical protein
MIAPPANPAAVCRSLRRDIVKLKFRSLNGCFVTAGPPKVLFATTVHRRSETSFPKPSPTAISGHCHVARFDFVPGRSSN